MCSSDLNSTTILWTSPIAGTSGDGVVIEGQPSGSISYGSTSSGGGWILESQEQLLNLARITLTARTGTPTDDGGLHLTFSVNGDAIEYYARRGKWTVTAGDFQALFYNLDGYAPDVYIYNSFAWASAPVIDGSQETTINFAAFVAQPGNMADTARTLGDPGGNAMPVDTWTGHGGSITHVSTTYGQRGWSVVMDHSGGAAITDPVGNAVFDLALVALPEPVSGESRIVGYLPDSFVSTQPVGFAQMMDQDLYKWRALAVQSGPPGAIWMATGE